MNKYPSAKRKIDTGKAFKEMKPGYKEQQEYNYKWLKQLISDLKDCYQNEEQPDLETIIKLSCYADKQNELINEIVNN